MSTLREPLTPGMQLTSDSGNIYRIEETLREQRNPLPCVYRACSGEKKYILKNMIPGEFEYQLDLQRRFSACPNIRAVTDTIQPLEMFIYPYLTGDLQHLSPKLKSRKTKVDILRNALQGLRDMHKRMLFITVGYRIDIKADNVLIEYEESRAGAGEEAVKIKSVQISDLEDTVLLPAGKWFRGGLCGNAIWRSPESWCRARQNISSDIFSFGIVMIYVMVDELVFHVGWEKLDAADAWRHVLARHISYFADLDGLDGLLKHIGTENPFYQRLVSLAENCSPRQPFETWGYVDPELRNLVGKMTCLDPSRRITAAEALEHPWFQ
ncbi:serine/threonine protein kinase [Nannizzia gypsea CBS 118893]|uniref:Serine/threonine protein kinase n=1 Tax=Arthroderma gypseum (strain ATCC MYA-4604 / CBS 118893) TaxID=535722 RepID=E5R0S1_ARTGP|nr:serine/threonine protein kinase [Nannizzia gypsea CBS 118893]EFQ97577.1 serine/threonine protein kinase [Nannizzia gypsea CBS 118893]